VALGFIAGWLAQFVTKESPGGGGLTGIVLTIAVGIIGAAVGGFIGTALDWGTVDDFDPRCWRWHSSGRLSCCSCSVHSKVAAGGEDSSAFRGSV
jgi:uncharacterized membrane protein YeaQ/YmgE (transglycosylase-associated protein family)